MLSLLAIVETRLGGPAGGAGGVHDAVELDVDQLDGLVGLEAVEQL